MSGECVQFSSVLVVSTDGARAAEPGEEHHGVCDTRKGGKSYHVNSNSR